MTACNDVTRSSYRAVRWWYVRGMKLFGQGMSTCTRKVLFTLHETNTPFEMIASTS